MQNIRLNVKMPSPYPGPIYTGLPQSRYEYKNMKILSISDTFPMILMLQGVQ